MALAYTVTHGVNVTTSPVTTSLAHTVAVGDLVIVGIQLMNDTLQEVDAATPITKTGSAYTWTRFLDTAPTVTSARCATRFYAAYATDAGSFTFTHNRNVVATTDRRMSVWAITGVSGSLATDIPAGNRFVDTVAGGTNVSQAITPTKAGSIIIGGIGDWAQTNSFSALTSNAITDTVNSSGQYTAVWIEPTTNPLASTATFTWGANSTASNTTWAVFEVVPVGLPTVVAGISTAVAPVGPFKLLGSSTVFSVVTDATTGLSIGASATAARRCQSFTLAAPANISGVRGFIAKTGAPTDNIQVDIYLTDGTKPVGSSLGTSSPISGTALTTTPTRTTFTFPTPVAVSGSTQYAAVFSRSGAFDVANNFSHYRYSAGTNVNAAEFSGNYNSSTTVWGSATADTDLAVIETGYNYYFFGRDGTTATTLQAFKSTAPDTSWATIANKTGFATAIQYISAYQVGGVVHMCITDGATTSINHKYQTFDAATDTFVTAETINTALNTTNNAAANQYGHSIVVRAGGTPPEVVVHYQAARISNRSQTAYRRRTGVATWAAGVAVSASGVDCTTPIVVLGASDRLHFLWHNATNVQQRHLTSANVIGTAASTGATAVVQDVITIASGTPNFIGLTATSAFRWASADNPTVTNAAVTLGTPVRGADASSVSYALYQSSTDSDLYIKTSSDNGATWGTAISDFVGTVASADANLSKNQMLYTRGSATVFPYLVNDNGTLKYDEYTVSGGVTHYTMPAATGALTAAGQATTLTYARALVMPVTVGTLTLAGQDVTLTKAAGAVHRTMPADVGTLTLAGQAVTLKRTRVMPAATGALTLAGQPAALRVARKVVANTGALTLAGQPVVLRVTMPAALGTLTLAGQPVTLRYTRTMPAALGTITLAGAAPNLVYSGAGSKSMPAGLGALTLAGQPVTLRYAHKLIATVGTLTLAGQATGLRASHAPLTATLGTITLAGQLVTTRFAHRTVAGLGTLTLAGQTAITRYAHRMPAGVGALTLGGQNVTLRFSHKTPAGLGTITLAGVPVNLVYSGAGSKTLIAGTGALTLGGQAVTLRAARKLPATLGTVTLSGKPVALQRGRKITVDPKAIVLEGKAAGLNYHSPARLIAGAGVLSLAGCDVTLPIYRRPPTIVQENLKFGRSVYVSRW